MERFLYGEEYAKVQSRDIPGTLCKMVDRYFPISPSDRILEVGVGNGALFPYLHDHASAVVGVDINEWLLRHSGKPCTVIGDAKELPFRDGSFNSTISLHTLEHIPNVSAVFQELDRVTINGGYSFHIFPSFVLTRAEGAILETHRIYPFNPLRAWKEANRLHINRLNPEKINNIIGPTNFHLIFSRRTFVPETKGINWVILLQKS